MSDPKYLILQIFYTGRLNTRTAKINKELRKWYERDQHVLFIRQDENFDYKAPNKDNIIHELSDILPNEYGIIAFDCNNPFPTTVTEVLTKFKDYKQFEFTCLLENTMLEKDILLLKFDCESS